MSCRDCPIRRARGEHDHDFWDRIADCSKQCDGDPLARFEDSPDPQKEREFDHWRELTPEQRREIARAEADRR